jgi:ribonuclease P protein component
LSYEKNLFGKTYCFIDEKNNEIVCAFTVSNDSVKASFMDNSSKRRIRKKLAQSKATLKSYPAVLIGRLGVNLKYQQYKLGSQLLDFIKSWFIDGMNKTGCRFILVDAYNDEKPLNYYFKNDFAAIFKSEKEEKEYYKIKSEDSLRTRLLFFDLIKLKA